MRAIRRSFKPVLPAIFALAVLASNVHGQDNDLEKLRAYIDQNQELLLEAETLVRGTNSSKARTSLDAARQLHIASIKELESDRPLLSARTAQQARNAILKAIQLAKREANLEERALKTIDYAQRRNEVARALLDEVGGGDSTPAGKLIEEATNQLLRAHRNMREHMFEVAIQSANASTDMSNRAIQLLKRDTVGPELVLREIARTEQLLERIDERADGMNNPQLNRMLADAHDFQNRARNDASSGRYLLAFEHTKRARNIARRIINRAGGSMESTAESAARAIELTDNLIERAYEIARDGSNDRAVKRLDDASRIQRNAHDAYNAGQYNRAVEFTRRARDVARKTMGSANRDVDAGSAKRAL
jgi:hypothetical protein